MGCDIHLYGETQKTPAGDWTACGEWGTDKYGNWELISNPLYFGRHYALFSVLADVRNYNELPLIAPAKGLPLALSPEVARMAEQWDCDGHSHSYLTLKELLEFNWYQPITSSGLVPWPAYVTWKDRHPWDIEEGPSSWARAVTGEIISQEEADARIKTLSRAEKDDLRRVGKADPLNILEHPSGVSSPWVDASWETPLLTYTQEFLGRIMGILGSQAPDGDLSRVRIVFWFDN